ncbi:MAG TPA: DUF3726 domain-containing protein [Dongiaceae bacterium]
MIDLSLNEAQTLAVRAARGAGFSWGLADDIGRAARMLAVRGEPWAEALLALTRLADGFAPPSPERAARWRCGRTDLPASAPLCPVRTAMLLIDAGVDPAAAPLRLAHVGLPIWLRALLQAAEATTRCTVDYGGGGALSQAADVTISTAATRPEARAPARRAPIGPDLLTELLSIAGRVYVPESERSRARGAGGGSVDGE